MTRFDEPNEIRGGSVDSSKAALGERVRELEAEVLKLREEQLVAHDELEWHRSRALPTLAEMEFERANPGPSIGELLTEPVGVG